jgi:hypothetical protein
LVVLAVLGFSDIGAAAQSPVTVLGGAKAKTIELQPCRPSRSKTAPPANSFMTGGCPGGKPYLIGSLSIAVKNTGHKDATAGVSFTGSADGKTVPIDNKGHTMAVLASNVPVSVPGNSRTVLPLRFAVGPGDEPEDLDGTVTVSITAGKKTADTTFPVSAKFVELGAVALQPAKLTILKGGGDHGVGHVELVGPGVRTLLLHLGKVKRQVRLSSDNGHSVLATVVSLKAAPGDPLRAELDITVASVGPGKYTGDLPLWELTPGSPKVGVELHDHRSRWIAFLLLLAGTVIGGLLLRLAALARRRELLEEVLDESLRAYKAVAPKPSDVVSWNLSALLDLDARAAGPRDIVRLQGADALQTSIRTARTDSDLAEDAARVLDMVARIQRWLRVEPAARRLAMVQSNLPDGDDAAQAWRALSPWADAQLLLEAVRSEAVDPETADGLVARLLHQARWQHRLLAVWTQWGVQGLTADEKKSRLTALYGKPPVADALTRTPAERNVLDARLDAWVAELDGDPGEPPKPVDPTGARLHVDWTADANNFTGWATLDRPSYGQLVRQSGVTSRTYSGRVLVKELQRLGWPDLLFALVAAGVSSAIYLPTIYNDTWGTSPDILTALLAGVGGPLVVKWAALPAFQSLRLRLSSAAAAPAAVPASSA